MLAVPAPPSIVILVDADACPVKDEVYRVAARHAVRVVVVSNAPIQVPRDHWIERVVVPRDMDAADDWIAERAAPGAIVVTADIPLAGRCLRAGAAALAPDGREWNENSIGPALAMRNLMQGLREAGAVTGGPSPFSPRSRSEFLSALDRAIVRLKRRGTQAAR